MSSNQSLAMFQILGQLATKAGKALSQDREAIKKSLDNILQRYVEVDVEKWVTENGEKKKIIVKEKRINDLDTIMPHLYAIASRTNNMRHVPPYVFHNMIRVQRHIRTLERARKHFIEKQKKEETKEENKEKKTVVEKTLGINLDLIDPEVLYEHELSIFFDFLQAAISQILQYIIPGITKDISVPIVPFGPKSSQGTESVIKPGLEGWEN